MVVTSLRPEEDIYTGVKLIPNPASFSNFIDLFREINFQTYIVNSLIVASSATSLALIISIFAAYSLTRLKYRGKEVAGRLLLFAYLFPSMALMIPLYILLVNLGLIDNLLGLILVYLTFTTPFSTWILRGYFGSIPPDLEEAAMVDGCSRIGAIFRVLLPVAAPGIVATTVFSFTLSWNEFLYALIIINSDRLRTVPIGILGLTFGDVYPWGRLMAAGVLASLPAVIIYLAMQKYVVQGLTAGAVKG
jgi:multiple sugar transport system permease protein